MALSKIEVPSLDVGQLGSRNLLINGDFKISQRGDYTSATSVAHNQLYVDRWVVRLTNVTANIQHIVGSHSSPGYPYKASNSLRLTATSTATGLLRHLQRVEGFLDGQTLTFSAWVKSNSPNARLFQYQHDGAYRVSSTPHSGNGGWEFLSVTATNAATTTNNLYFDAAIGSSTFTNIGITSGEYIEISEAQVEISDAPTPFEHESIGTTLQKCQRYFYKVGGTSGYPTIFPAYAPSTGELAIMATFPVTMRTTPSVSWENNNNLTFRRAGNGSHDWAPNDVNALSLGELRAHGGAIWFGGFSHGQDTLGVGHVRVSNGSNHLRFDAEL